MEEWLAIGLQWFTVEELAPYWAKVKASKKKGVRRNKKPGGT